MSVNQERKNYLKAYRESEKGKIVRKRYSLSEKGKINHRETNIRHYKLYPERVEARRAVNNAIRNNKLPRPDSLQCLCGKPAKQYHHHKGYEPEHCLDVIPVCNKCHIIVDRKIA